MKIKVLPTDAIVLNLEYYDNKMMNFIGKRQDKTALACINTGEVVELDITKPRYRNYYLQKLKDKDLLPADEFTSNLVKGL